MPQTRERGLRFTRVRLENWRNFTLADVPLRRRTFLVGPNASGKSNFLDALRFLRDVASPGGGLAAALAKRGGVAEMRALAASRDAVVGIQVQLGSRQDPNLWSYTLAFGQNRRGQPEVEREIVAKSGQLLLRRPDASDIADPQRLTQTHLEQVTANQPFREIADCFSSVRYLHVVPQLVREPERWAPRDNDPYGADLLDSIAGSDERLIEARLRRINEVMRLAIPQLDEVQLLRDERTGAPHLRWRYVHWRAKSAWQDEKQCSDGTLRLLGLLWALIDGTGPVLLEEPELTLHPGVVRHLPHMLTRAQRRIGRQAVISTHSHEILEAEDIEPDEVLILQPRSEGTAVAPASEVPQVSQLLRDGLSMADAAIPLTRPVEAMKLSLVLD